MKCGAKALLDPLWDLDKFWDRSYKYSGLKINEMWGKSFVTPAVGLGQIFEIFLRFYNTAGVRIKICGAKACLDPLWDIDKFSRSLSLSLSLSYN